jgi:hypothetical protein
MYLVQLFDFSVNILVKEAYVLAYNQKEGCKSMGVTYISFFVILSVVILICAMVTWVINLGVRKDFALTYDFYLWKGFASDDEELARKINKTLLK